MSDAKFTPGPWMLRKVVVYGAAHQGFAIDFNDDQEQVVDYVYEEADAHLITAAPDLYEALQSFERIKDIWLPEAVDEQHGEEMYVLHMARNNMLTALAKARGES